MAALNMLVVVSQAIFTILVQKLLAAVAATRFKTAVPIHVRLAIQLTILLSSGLKIK
jgi:hypothetical protein